VCTSETNINLRIIVGVVSNHVNIEVPDDEQYERIKRVKTNIGLTWRGMLIHAADDLRLQLGSNRWFA